MQPRKHFLFYLEIPFENTEINQPPVITLESKIFDKVLIETKLMIEFKVIDIEGADLEIKTYFIEKNKGNEITIRNYFFHLDC